MNESTWCTAHDAQGLNATQCWRRFYGWMAASGPCSLVAIEEDPVLELDRLDDPEALVPPGWVVQVDTGAVRMISRQVGRRRALPTEMF